MSSWWWIHSNALLFVEVVKLLSTLGADVVCPDEAEATAYDWAMQGVEGWHSGYGVAYFGEWFPGKLGRSKSPGSVTPKRWFSNPTHESRNIQVKDL